MQANMSQCNAVAFVSGVGREGALLLTAVKKIRVMFREAEGLLEKSDGVPCRDVLIIWIGVPI